MSEKPLGIRFSKIQIARSDRIAKELSKRAEGTKVTRSDAIRAALNRGFDELEKEFSLSRRG